MSFLIAYTTLSGNTQEVAELVEQTLIANQIEVTTHRIGRDAMPSLHDFDAMIIGSYTWRKGSTPEEVKDFVADIGFKPENVYVFGTGDTQFGGDALFCHAAVKLARFYESDYMSLRIEQSPRGEQEELVVDWTKGVAEHWKHLVELKY